MIASISTTLVWSALVLFASGTLAYSRKAERVGRIVVALGWVVFGVFWATKVEYFLYAQDSVIEGALAAVALPIGIYAGYITYRDSPPALFTLARAATVMGSIYLLVAEVDFVRRWAIEAVTIKTVWVVERLFGHELLIQEGPVYGYQSGIAAPNAPGGLLLTHIELVCTGLGSIAIAVGLIAVLDEPLRKRLAGAFVATVFIYALNVVRTVFITSAYVGQWFPFYEARILSFTGYQDPRVASFFIADKVIAQSLSVAVLLAMFAVMVRVFPSFYALVDELRTLAPSK